MGNLSAGCANWLGRMSLVNSWQAKEKAATAVCTSVDEFTTLKDRKKEIGRELLAKMGRDPQIDPHEL